jgi:RND family efflux transporter MFP subunit
MAEKRIISESTSDKQPLKTRFTESAKQSYSRSTNFIKRKPLGSFVFFLVLLLAVLLLSRLLQQTPEETETQKITKNVEVYSIGDGPKATYQARIEKTGVITIVAQSPGIVQNIAFKEGDTVTKGQQIISLSSNYQGGNAASVQRQIAQKQYQNVLDTFDTQNQLIQQQQVVATASAENAQRTRDITRQSLGETSDLINANQDQLNQLNTTLDTLETTNPAGANNEQVGELQGTITQLQGGINQLRAAQRTSEYQASNDNPPATLANAQEEIALKQLDVQRKTLELNRDVSKLQVKLAYVTEAMMYPASPFTGTIENIAVRQGQAVNAGTELATIAADDIVTSAQLQVPQSVASMLSVGEPSTAKVNNKMFQITPYYVSKEATSGQLYSVKYDIPAEYQKEFADGEYITIQVPLKMADTTAAVPLIPIDAVYQTQEKSFVLVASKNKAMTKDIKVGEVFGNYVEVESGLSRGDQVILNRNVISDDAIKIQ